MSSSKEQLVVLLYENLLLNLRRAMKQIQAEDIEGKAESLEKASSIVFELLESLNFEEGGDLASRLAALYAYLISEIQDVGRSLDTERLARVIDTVNTLYEAWAEAARAVARGSPEPGQA